MFGTLHLNDKRLFRFDDSVYAAVEHTAGFANEVDMNEIAAYYINKTIDELGTDEIKLKDVLSEQELKDMAKPLAKRFNKKAEDITTRDILKEKNKWMSDYFNKGEMPTFVDAYLFDIARRQGHRVGGIEDLEDQTGMIDRSDVHMVLAGSDSLTLEKMITLYINQDLDGINSAMNKYDAGYRDALLTRRNIKMARRMDSLSHERSMFFAVGAAHLLGDSGVVNLLRARGFTLEPVMGSKKIFSKDYKFDEVPLQWQEVTDGQNLYKVSMPGVPATVKLYGLIEMKFLLEFSNLSGYCTMAVVGPQTTGNWDSLFHQLAVKVYHREKLKPPKRVVNGEIEGVEYNERVESYHMRLQLFGKDNVIYMAMVYGNKPAYLKTGDVERFFKSFTATEREAKATGSGSYMYTDSLAGLSFMSPAKMELNEKLTKQSKESADWEIVFHTGQDIASGAYVMVMQRQVKLGHFIPNDSIANSDFISPVKDKYHATIGTRMIDGYTVTTLEGTSDEAHMQLVAYVKGNKSLGVMLITQAHSDDPRLQQVFSTLHIFPYKKMPFSLQTDSAGTFNAWAPSEFRRKIRKGDIYWRAFDSLSALNYGVIADSFGTYAWVDNVAEYMSERAKGYIEEGDSLLWNKVVTNGQDKGREVLLRKKGCNVYERTRILLHGNIGFSVFTAGQYGDVISADAEKFFTSFRALQQSDFELGKNKCADLLGALKSKDSATRVGAYRALDAANFSKRDLPLLHKSVIEEYGPVGFQSIGWPVNVRLAVCAGKLGDESSVRFAKKEYPRLDGKADYLKYSLLEMLACIKTEESYNTLATLIVTLPPHAEAEYLLIAKLKDSLPLLKHVMPVLAKGLADTSIGPGIAELMVVLNDSGLLSIDEIKLSEKDLVALGDKMAGKYAYMQEYHRGVAKLIHLLGCVGTPAAIVVLSKFQHAGDIYMRGITLVELARAGAAIDTAVMDSMAANKVTRIAVYQDLKDIGRDSLYPRKYLTQQSFAEAELWNSDPDVEWGNIEPVTKNLVDGDGEHTVYYLFKLEIAGEDSTTKYYLGVAGPYTGDELLPDKEHAQTGVYWAEEYTDERRDELFQSYMELVEQKKEH